MCIRDRPLGVPDPELPAAGGSGPLAAHLARDLRRARRAHLQLRAPGGGLPPRGHPLPLSARVDRLRRVPLLRAGWWLTLPGPTPRACSTGPIRALTRGASVT